VDEHQLMLAWRNLFRGCEVTPETLAKADALLEGLSGESPLYLRLASELADLKGATGRAKKRPVRRNVT
jgi:hypothetical protein